MAILTKLFDTVIEDTFVAGTEIFLGSGTLPAFHTLIVHCGRTDNDSTSVSGLGSEITVDGVSENRISGTQGQNGTITAAAATYHFMNLGPNPIDLTNNIGIIPIASTVGVTGESVLAVDAFTVDDIVDSAAVSPAVFVATKINATERVLAAGQFTTGHVVVPVGPATAGLNFTSAASTNPTTIYTEVGIEANPTGANLPLTLTSLDWLGKTTGDTCSIDVDPIPDGTDNGAAIMVVWEPVPYTVQAIDPGTVTLLLRNRPTEAPIVSVGAELLQSYELGLLFSTAVQPYSSAITKSLIHPLDSLQSIVKKALITGYNLGITDVAVSLEQNYGVSVRSASVQDYDNLSPVAAAITQPYFSTVSVSTDFTSSYDLLATDVLKKALVSHYSSYEFSNVIVITTPPGLTYKPGYTIEPDS